MSALPGCSAHGTRDPAPYAPPSAPSLAGPSGCTHSSQHAASDPPIVSRSGSGRVAPGGTTRFSSSRDDACCMRRRSGCSVALTTSTAERTVSVRWPRRSRTSHTTPSAGSTSASGSAGRPAWRPLTDSSGMPRVGERRRSVAPSGRSATSYSGSYSSPSSSVSRSSPRPSSASGSASFDRPPPPPPPPRLVRVESARLSDARAARRLLRGLRPFPAPPPEPPVGEPKRCGEPKRVPKEEDDPDADARASAVEKARDEWHRPPRRATHSPRSDSDSAQRTYVRSDVHSSNEYAVGVPGYVDGLVSDSSSRSSMRPRKLLKLPSEK